MKDNFGFTHKSGVFMAVSALPSPYGIGSFGEECFKFIDFLSEAGQRVWQVLPLNPTAYGDSPYQSPSALAGNPYFIDLEGLKNDGLLTEDDLKECLHDTEAVDYGWLFENRYKVLRKAFSAFYGGEDYFCFLAENGYWLEDYALFMALKVKNGYQSWDSWEEKYKVFSSAKAHREDLKEEMDFWRFLQYKFFTQWRKILTYAHQKNILIVGDMPIYVAFDSVDVWARPDQFLLDENLAPTIVAGCPPDGFSPDGQLWGNPIYDWKRMAGEGFSWWITRASHSLKMYDILRIDHFRGFAGFYAVPFGEATARNGEWLEGPGYPLFSAIEKAVPALKVIAEDLGLITEDVRLLMRQTGFPGMKMLQFAFYDEDSEFLPRTYKNPNCVTYTGTHDSDATAYWVENLSEKTRGTFLKECPVEEGVHPVDALILFAHKSMANLSMVPLIDYMRLGNEARMNTPATASGNWTWRLKGGQLNKELKDHVLNLTRLGGRL